MSKHALAIKPLWREFVVPYFGLVEFERREDLRMDEVELRLELVTAGVVRRERLLVHHQMLSAAGKPETQQMRQTHTHTHTRSDLCEIAVPLHPALVLLRVQH